MKRAAWKLYQQHDLRLADAFQATSDAEARDIRELGLKQPIAVIPNGVEFPTLMHSREPRLGKRILCLSRIHPVKGLINLVKAFHQADIADSWKLTIAGSDETGHQAELEALVKTLALADRISFTGPVDDGGKWNLYADADLFVLPSFTENFGISVAEAMAAGLPVITTTGTPWGCLQSENMGWWVEPSVSAIATALRDASRINPEARMEMGARGRIYASSRFSWPSVAERVSHFYEYLLDGTLANDFNLDLAR